MFHVKPLDLFVFRDSTTAELQLRGAQRKGRIAHIETHAALGDATTYQIVFDDAAPTEPILPNIMTREEKYPERSWEYKNIEKAKAKIMTLAEQGTMAWLYEHVDSKTSKCNYIVSVFKYNLVGYERI